MILFIMKVSGPAIIMIMWEKARENNWRRLFKVKSFLHFLPLNFLDSFSFVSFLFSFFCAIKKENDSSEALFLSELRETNSLDNFLNLKMLNRMTADFRLIIFFFFFLSITIITKVERANFSTSILERVLIALKKSISWFHNEFLFL